MDKLRIHNCNLITKQFLPLQYRYPPQTVVLFIPRRVIPRALFILSILHWKSYFSEPDHYVGYNRLVGNLSVQCTHGQH